MSECEFVISWSFGPWDLGTPGLWNPWTLGLLDLFPPSTPPHTSPYILLHPPISSSYSPPLVWFGYGGGRVGVVTLENEIGNGHLTFILILKSCVVDGWNPVTSSFLLHFLPLTSSHLLLIPPYLQYNLWLLFSLYCSRLINGNPFVFLSVIEQNIRIELLILRKYTTPPFEWDTRS